MGSCLVRIGKAAHATHDTENVVVRRIDTDRGARGRTNRVVGDREEERGVINAGQVARARRLVVLRLEGEGVDVDTDRRAVGVVLVRLDQVEVLALTDGEAVVAVELDERRDDRVLARHALDARDGVATVEDRAVPPVGVVERLLALPGVDNRIVAADERITLDNPDELLTRVVEVELELVGGARDGLTARELEALDEVLVRDLGELAALVRVEVDVVNIEGRRNEARGGNTVTDGVRVGELGRGVPAEVTEVVELEVDTDLVVLEGDERERKTRVAVEPELEGDVERVLGGALGDLLRRVGRNVGDAVGVAVLATLDKDVDKLRDVTNHLGVASLLARLLGELIPDLEPVTVLLVNALATDLKLNGLDEVVARPVEPAELGTRAVRGGERDLGERRLEVHAVDQVTVALDRARDLLAEVRRTIERVLNGLHGEVRVAAVNHLEERNLGVTREVNVLSTISYKLHQPASSHIILYPRFRK